MTPIAEISPCDESPPRFGVGLIVRFLLGSRTAIETVSRAPRPWLPVALGFVFSAALAREYDGEYLLAQPWYLLVPLAVSLPMALTLWIVLFTFACAAGKRTVKFGQGALALLTCYWLTAPLAWLYAIPYEHFCDPLLATKLNLWTLALVAAWRVVLITRVAAILLRCSALVVLSPVLFFASTATFIALLLAPVPPLAVMGGIRLNDTERLVAEVGLIAQFVAFFAIPLSFVTSVILAIVSRRRGASAAAPQPPRAGTPTRGLQLFAVGTMLIWACVLPFTQPEQRLRWLFESSLRRGEIREALALASAHSRDDFPPLWSPVSRPWQNKGSYAPLLDVLEQIAVQPPAEWVRAAHVAALRDMLADRALSRGDCDADLPRLADVLAKLPEGWSLARDFNGAYKMILASALENPHRSPAARDALTRIVELGEE